MSREDTIRMAEQCNSPERGDWFSDEDALLRFAALVAAHDRELCAKVCEAHGLHEYFPSDPRRHVTYAVAAAIRARGTT